MATITRVPEADDAARALPDGFNLSPPRSRRVRFSQLLIGLALMIACSLGAVLLHLSTTHRDPVLALAHDVHRGHVIESADLRVVYVSSDTPFAHVARADAASVIGRVAAVELPTGTLLTKASVAGRAMLGPEEGVVGLALEPGQYPTPEVKPGDVVNVVATAGDGRQSVAANGAESALAEGAEVYAVDILDSQGRRFVSLRLPKTAANRVAAAAGRGGLRLVLVGR